MASRFSRAPEAARSVLLPGLILLAASCSYDLDGFTPSGGSSDAGGAASSSTSGSPSATSTSATTGSASASGGAPATTATSSTGEATSTAAETSSSSGAGGAGPLAFCDIGGAPLVDDFDAPAIDPTVWLKINAVTEENNHVRAKVSGSMDGPLPALLTPLATTNFTGDCALTVHVVPPTNGVAAFAVSNGVDAELHVQYVAGKLSAFGSAASLDAQPPFSLALVAHDGGVYAAADAGQGWQLLAGPVASPSWAAQAHVAFGQFGALTTDNARFDDFDVATISLADLGP
jgi:hypothetical protein